MAASSSWPNIRVYRLISSVRVISMLAVGISSAVTESSKIQKPAAGTPDRSVFSGMMSSETVGTDISSSSRPSCPACTSAVPNQVRSACSSSTTRNFLPRSKTTFCRSMRAATAASRSSGASRKPIQNDSIAAQYAAVWNRPGITLCS